jgi:hypothetical protein
LSRAEEGIALDNLDGVEGPKGLDSKTDFVQLSPHLATIGWQRVSI